MSNHSPLIEERLLEGLSPQMIDKVKNLLLQHSDYIVDTLFCFQSVRRHTEPSGEFLDLLEKNIYDPSLFKYGCRDEYIFNLSIKLSPDEPVIWMVSTEISRIEDVQSKNNPSNGWWLESWFPEDGLLPDKVTMMQSVENELGKLELFTLPIELLAETYASLAQKKNNR